MGFSQGLSGLNGSSKALEAIGNNVANAGTVGYKSQAAQFSDIFAAAGGAADQVGIGVQIAGVTQNFSQGSIATSTNPLDLAINGGGLFRMSNAGTITYTRNGQFQLNKSGFLVNAAGLQLTGLGADPVTGAIIPGNYVPLQINNSAIPPQVTSLSQVQLNLDSRAKPPSTMTSGNIIAQAAPGTPIITAGANDTLTGMVDGTISFNIVIPPVAAPGYTSTAALATAVQNAINNTGVVAGLPAQKGLSGTSAQVTVSVNSSTGGLQISSNSVGTVGSTGSGSSSVTTGGNAAANLGFAEFVAGTGVPAPGVGTSGTATGNAAPASLTITSANNTITGFVDGKAFNVTIPSVTYASAAALATAVATAINTALGAGSVVDSIVGGAVKLTSGTTGVNSLVTLTGGNGASNLGFPVTAGVDGFSPTNTSSFTSSTAQTVYDSLGNPHTLQLYYAQTSKPGTWQMYTSLDGNIPIDPATSLPFTSWAASGKTVDFNTAGVMKTPMPLSGSYAVATGATKTLTFSIDLTGTTQYGISFGTNQMLQDGFTSGKLSGMSVSSDGIVQGSYSNGKNRNMGQVVLANFNNLSGLQSLGGNQWAETAVSGQPIPGIPGTGNLGSVQSGATEASNVDLTSALVDMITQQRAYQASAQSIKTLDQLMQTLVNLR